MKRTNLAWAVAAGLAVAGGPGAARGQQPTRMEVVWNLDDAHLDANRAQVAPLLDGWCEKEAKQLVKKWDRSLVFWKVHANRGAKGPELVIALETPPAGVPGNVSYAVNVKGVWGAPAGGYPVASGTLEGVAGFRDTDTELAPDRKLAEIVAAMKKDVEKKGLIELFKQVPVADGGVPKAGDPTLFELPLQYDDIGESRVVSTVFRVQCETKVPPGQNPEPRQFFSCKLLLPVRDAAPAGPNRVHARLDKSLDPAAVRVLSVFLVSTGASTAGFELATCR